MSTLVLPAPTRQELEDPDFEPLPMLAPGTSETTLMPYKIGLPTGDGRYSAEWDIEADMMVAGCYVRYTQNFPARFIYFAHPRWLIATDNFTIYYYP